MCGNKFNSHGPLDTGVKNHAPAENASEISERAMVVANNAVEKTKQTWTGFSRNERIIAGGAFMGLVSFILPWISGPFASASGLDMGSESPIFILMLFSMIGSLAVLYTSRGASDIGKTRKAWLHMVIGFAGGALGILWIIAINVEVNKCLWLCGRVGLGLYLFAAGAITVLVGAFKLRSELSHRKSD